jgi:hypothetical protein
MRLTDRSLTTGVTKQDLIHIVITGDTSQSPEGSSYKAKVGQILELYNLPVPNIKLYNTTFGAGIDVDTITSANTVGPTIKLINPPFLTANDLSQEQINNNVFLEMVQYKNKKKYGTINQRLVGGRYIVQPSITLDGSGNTINDLQTKIYNYYGKTITNRGGVQNYFSGGSNTLLAVNRVNHIQISDVNEIIDLSSYFAGRYIYNTIYYIDEFGASNSLPNIPVPFTNRSKNFFNTQTSFVPFKSKWKSGLTGSPYRLCYNGNLTSLYIAFRYIMFDPDSNNGNGKFITGPLTPTIKVTNRYFPVTKTTTEGRCRANNMITGFESNIMFSYVNKP